MGFFLKPIFFIFTENQKMHFTSSAQSTFWFGITIIALALQKGRQ